MGHSSNLLRSPKKEEQEVPDSIFPKLSEADHVYADKKKDIMDELEGILGIDDEENSLAEGNMYSHLNWDLMDWEGFSVGEEDEEEEEGDQKVTNVTVPFQEESHYNYNIKRENYGFWDDLDEQKRVSLNLSLNYQEVLDAWSGRGSLWADDYSLSMANNCYMGEVPVMEGERARRKASVLRYKKKRQSRLFSKKIRYEVRKLNADKRPRLKGRFVKRVPEKILK